MRIFIDLVSRHNLFQRKLNRFKIIVSTTLNSNISNFFKILMVICTKHINLPSTKEKKSSRVARYSKKSTQLLKFPRKLALPSLKRNARQVTWANNPEIFFFLQLSMPRIFSCSCVPLSCLVIRYRPNESSTYEIDPDFGWSPSIFTEPSQVQIGYELMSSLWLMTISSLSIHSISIWKTLSKSSKRTELHCLRSYKIKSKFNQSSIIVL